MKTHLYKSRFFIILLFFSLVSFVNATAITAIGGNWSSASTWSVINRTGTISTTSGSKTVMGVGTLFTTEFAVGSILKTLGGITIGTVASITSDTSLTLVANATLSNSGIAFMAQVVPKASDDVLISSGITVTLDTNVYANSISISGILALPKNSRYTLNTQLVVVTSSGIISFDHSSLNLLSTVSMYLQNGPNSLGGDCNNNDEIFVGSVQYGVCTGGGAQYLFSTIEAAGGINIVTAGGIGTAQTICSGIIPVAFTSTTAVNSSGTITYEWQTNESGSFVTLGFAIAATYSPPALTSTTSYQRRTVSSFGSNVFYSAYTTPVTVTVNPNASIVSVTGKNTLCFSETAIYTANTVVLGGGSGAWSSSNPAVATVSSAGLVTGLSAGNANIIYTITGGCGGIIFAQQSVTITPLCVGGTVAGATSVCTGINNTVLTLSGQTGTVTSWESSLDNFATTNTTIANTLSSLTVSNLVTTESFRAVLVSGCSTNKSNPATVTVNTLLAPSAVISNQPDCITPTGSVVLSGLPTSGSINQTGSSTASYAISGTQMTISGLSPGTYNFTTTNASGCTSSPMASPIVINAVITNTWNVIAGVGSWTNGTPTSSNLVVINGNYNTSSNGNLNACTLIINSGKTLTITAGDYAIIQNDLTVNGVLEVLDQGSLVMINDSGIVTNSGTTNIHRFTTSFKLYDYIYWSTPIVTTNIATTFLGWRTDKAYLYSPAISNWSFASTMYPGNGYIIMVPAPTTVPLNNPSEVIFSGKLNNGLQNINGIVANSYYLLGNPYASALSADKFLNQNAGVLNGTLYFWTHNTAIQLATNILDGSAGSGLYAYTSDDYASYNTTGGVGIVATSTGSNQNAPSGNIASGQGFFASSKTALSGSSIVFNNNMRVNASGALLNNSQFFKTSNTATKMVNAVEKDRIWLNLSNTQGAFKQTLVGYITDATNDFDDRFDGESIDGNIFVDFYSVLPDKNLTIQGRALPFDQNDMVPLGYRTTINGVFTVNIDQVDGLLTNQSVFLEDKLTNTITDLKSGNYTFTTVAGTYNDRLVLRYTNKILATSNFDVSTNKVLVSTKSKQIKVNSFAETIDTVSIYDLLGRQIYQKRSVNTNELSIANLVSSHQTLVVKTSLLNGAVFTDKIIF